MVAKQKVSRHTLSPKFHYSSVPSVYSGRARECLPLSFLLLSVAHHRMKHVVEVDADEDYRAQNKGCSTLAEKQLKKNLGLTVNVNILTCVSIRGNSCVSGLV